jgi:hypothetical protein
MPAAETPNLVQEQGKVIPCLSIEELESDALLMSSWMKSEVLMLQCKV